MNLLTSWFKRHFADPQVVLLAVVLLVGFLIVIFMGNMLAPVLASIVIAYLLEGIVGIMTREGLHRLAAVIIVYLLFVTFLVVLLFGLMPLLSRQTTQLVQQFPAIVAAGQQALMGLPERFPEIITQSQVEQLMVGIRTELAGWGQEILSMSLSSVVGVITIMIYVILVPLLVFFFMKDKDRIVRWFVGFMPRDRSLAQQVWRDVDVQIGNYVRGKFWEIVIVWAFTYTAFAFMNMNYAMLLSALVGLSVVIPYIGAAVVTIPVVLLAYFQWGWGPDFFYLVIAYLVIQALDGNVLVPLLFSEVVNLHPVAIIVAILVFGGLWGFWGVFFAIPLATLVQAVLRAWPRLDRELEPNPG
ncbi:MAG: AI-2E family transporter [Chromatiales bacterium]|nr:AI-2E family transporter [Chromatiales bacterium]